MKLLLDTHVLLWWLREDERLSRRTLELLVDSSNEFFVSAVSAVEMGTKLSIGKLKLEGSVEQTIHQVAEKLNATELPITVAHGAKLGELPMHHRDPFDRLLIAQAAIEGLTLVSADPELPQYGVPVIA